MEVEKKYCSHCQRDVKIERFEEGFKTCNRCRKNCINHYHRNPEKYAEYKKQFRENCPEQYKEQRRKQGKIQREKIKDVMITCPVCNYSIKKYKKSQHEQSKFHQESLRRQEHPEEYEEEDKPDERVVINDLEYDYCYCCNFRVRPWEWRWHIEEERHKRNKMKHTLQ